MSWCDAELEGPRLRVCVCVRPILNTITPRSERKSRVSWCRSLYTSLTRRVKGQLFSVMTLTSARRFVSPYYSVCWSTFLWIEHVILWAPTIFFEIIVLLLVLLWYKREQPIWRSFRPEKTLYLITQESFDKNKVLFLYSIYVYFVTAPASLW